MKRLVKYLILVLPFCLFFSYYPVMHFGTSESMNFEISVPILWLVIFDIVSFVLMVKQKCLFNGFGRKRWVWLLLPVFLSLSILWSLNSLRGLLTVGILWLIYFAIYAMFNLKSIFNEEFRGRFWKWFFISTLVVCGWCVVQCVLDLIGVSREYSLMCVGCTYKSFGFPHPNGFAIEPQFMGNLLLAPAIILGWLMLRSRPRPSGPSPRADGAKSRAAALRNAVSLKHYAIIFFIVVVVLFLTFSRGAIYAFIVAMIFMTAMSIWSSKSLASGHAQGRSLKLMVPSQVFRALTKLWIIIVVAFLFTLNLQGIMAAVSPTNDTYFSGISKALNHLSLGVIDIREQGKTEDFSEKEQAPESEAWLVENFDGVDEENSAFDGYVAESTDTRLKLTGVAMEVWSKDFQTAMFGVGLGGAGQALYVNNKTDSPKEIVQNQYASLLLETGIIGMILFIATIVLIIVFVFKKQVALVVLPLMVAYGVSLCFFAGLPNALHIYLLLPVVFIICSGNNSCHKSQLHA